MKLPFRTVIQEAAKALFESMAPGFYKIHPEESKTWDGLSDRCQQDWCYVVARMKRAGYDLSELIERLSKS